jgi:hypothetical protein
MAHGLADPQLALRAAGSGAFSLVVAGHCDFSKIIVMAGLVPAIHVFLAVEFFKTWMPGIKPGMTSD